MSGREIYTLKPYLRTGFFKWITDVTSPKEEAIKNEKGQNT
jgi:hypothetical protein